MAKNRGIKPCSKPHRLVRLDGRTHVAKLLNEYRDQLVEHIGGSPSITQTALIERAAFVHLRAALLDAKIVDGTFSEQDSRVYLAAVNTERRILQQLGFDAPAAPQRTLAETLRGIAASKAMQAAD